MEPEKNGKTERDETAAENDRDEDRAENRFSKEHGDHHDGQKGNGVRALKEASVACYERENRFYDTNWSKSVLHTRRIRTACFHVYDAGGADSQPPIDRREIEDTSSRYRRGQ